MKLIGKLQNGNQLVTDNGTVQLAIQGAPNPFAAATNFLANLGLSNGQRIEVTGSSGFVGNVPVFFITAAKPAPAQGVLSLGSAKKPASTAVGSKKAGGKSVAKKAAKKSLPSKKSGKKGSTKKSSKKSGGSKKAAKKSGKGAAKHK